MGSLLLMRVPKPHKAAVRIFPLASPGTLTQSCRPGADVVQEEVAVRMKFLASQSFRDNANVLALSNVPSLAVSISGKWQLAQPVDLKTLNPSSISLILAAPETKARRSA